jgi:hypothetical protein
MKKITTTLLLIILLLVSFGAHAADSCSIESVLRKADMRYLETDLSESPQKIRLFRNSFFGKKAAKLEGRRLISYLQNCYKVSYSTKSTLLKYQVFIELSDK